MNKIAISVGSVTRLALPNLMGFLSLDPGLEILFSPCCVQASKANGKVSAIERMEVFRPP